MDEEDYKLVRELRAKMSKAIKDFFIEEERKFTDRELVELKAKQMGLRVVEGGKH